MMHSTERPSNNFFPTLSHVNDNQAEQIKEGIIFVQINFVRNTPDLNTALSIQG